MRRFPSEASGLEQARKLQVELILDDGSLYPHKGRVYAVNRQVDVRTGTLEIEALFPNPTNFLRPGQFARVRVLIDTKKGALLIPQRAVTELQGGYQVAVVGTGNKVEIRSVKPGERYGSLWEIEEGLKPGERVVAEGVQKVKQGMLVNPKPFAPASSSAVPEASPKREQLPATGGDKRHVPVLHQTPYRSDGNRHHNGNRRSGRSGRAAGSAVSQHYPTRDPRTGDLRGSRRIDDRAVCGHPSRAADERRRQHELHVFPQPQQRLDADDC